MDADEIAWLDDYHARVRKILSPRVDGSTRGGSRGDQTPS